MAVWKQMLMALAVLATAAGIWITVFPGASAMLSAIGIEFAERAQDNSATNSEQSQSLAGADGHEATEVIVSPVTEATINNRLSAIGDGRAVRSVTINPSVTGRLVEVVRSSGERVKAGVIIARLDSEAERIAFDRATLSVKNAESVLVRAEQLRRSNTVSSVQVTDATLALENARLQLRDAELALERRSIAAPIGGVLGILPVEVGDYVISDTEIATIDDRSHILVDFRVPERFVNAVKKGATIRAEAISSPGRYYQGTVTAVDNRIERDSRTLLVQANLTNDDDELRGGMSFAVTMEFPGDNYPAVDPLAIQWATEGAYVWGVVKGKAERVPVRIIQRNIDLVLIDATIEAGMLVITEGVQRVRQGAAIAIAGGDSGEINKPDSDQDVVHTSGS